MNKTLMALLGATLIMAGTALANRYEQLSVGELTIETSIDNAGTFTSDAIAEDTSGSGVTIDSKVLVKDGQVQSTGTAGTDLWVNAPLATTPESWYTYFDDFFTAGYEANVTTNQAGKFSEAADEAEWLVSVTDGGGDNAETIVVSDTDAGGYLVITANNAANDDVEIQKNGEAFAITTTKDLWYEAKIVVEDCSTNTIFAGLTVSDTDILGSLGNDFIGFYMDRGSNMLFQSAKNGVITTNSISTTIADATAYRLGFYVDGSASNTYVFLDGTCVATNTADANIPNDEKLSPAFCTRTVDTGADYLKVDYIKVSAQR